MNEYIPKPFSFLLFQIVVLITYKKPSEVNHTFRTPQVPPNGRFYIIIASGLV